MEIRLYKNFSEDRQVNKDIQNEIILNGTLVDENVDVMNPVITIELNTEYLLYNYAYIPAFKRYYFFATPPSIVNNGLFQIYLHVDVLMSFKGTPEASYSDGFLGNSGFVETTASYGNFYLTDSNLPLQQNTKMTTIKHYDTIFSQTGETGSNLVTMIMNCTNVSAPIVVNPPTSETET